MRKSNKMDLLDSTRVILENVRDFLRQISQAVYTNPCEPLSGGTIGQHVRHSIEFYQCLISQCPKTTINYDLRPRDLKIETDPQSAEAAIDRILDKLPRYDLMQDLVLVSGIHEAGVATNFGRELLYNLEHLIHHLAIIRIAVHDLAPEVQLSDQFGIAPSTLRHRAMGAVK